MLLPKTADWVWGAAWPLLFGFDDVRRWPNFEFGDLYAYCPFTKETLKAYKSLEVFNYFHSGYVHKVYLYQNSPTSKYVILKAKVNPSQKSATDAHNVK